MDVKIYAILKRQCMCHVGHTPTTGASKESPGCPQIDSISYAWLRDIRPMSIAGSYLGYLPSCLWTFLFTSTLHNHWLQCMYLLYSAVWMDQCCFALWVIQCTNEGFGSKAPTSQPVSTDDCRCRLIGLNATIAIPWDTNVREPHPLTNKKLKKINRLKSL